MSRSDPCGTVWCAVKPRAKRPAEARGPRRDTEGTGSGTLLAAALTRENLQRAWRWVKANKGSAGVDGLDIEQTGQYLKTAWPDIRGRLLRGMYRPSPVRRAHDAVLAAQSYVQSGRRVVVDVDLEKFFGRVNHDILMDRLGKRIGDAATPRLIRA